MLLRGRRSPPSRRSLAASAGLVPLLLAVGCSSSPAVVASQPAVNPSLSLRAGVTTVTFVDPSRPTAAWGPSAERATRTLVTTIFYPTGGPPRPAAVPGALPDRVRAPYPLIVFAHGLGASPSDYAALLSSWASAGFVVAAPRFPLSSNGTPGGPDGGDVDNQPGDMSYVIGALIHDSAATSGLLSGLVDPREIGAAGHSNGAITTLGLVANTCCRDDRVKAAVVMAGTTEGFPSGVYDFSDAPPLLLVHGTADELVPYRSGLLVFNQARGPKGLLTVRGGSHGAAAGLSPPSSSIVIRSTTDFFDAYLAGDTAAVRHLSAQVRSGVTTLDFDPTVGSTSTLPLPAPPITHLRATVTPNSHLTGGESVAVTWSGYTAGKVVNVLECSNVDLTTASSVGCDFSNAKILYPDPHGSGSLTFKVVTGRIGNGLCDAAHQGCSIVVNNGSSTDPSESRLVPITFAP